MIPSIFGGRSVGVLDAALDILFRECEYGVDSRLTCTGGANGTRVNSAGVLVPASCPRLDFDPNAFTAKGLWLNETRTNLALRSADLSTGWALVTIATTANQKVAPDGTNSGWLLVANNGTSSSRITQAFTPVAGTTYTLSGWLAPSGRTSWRVQMPSAWWADATGRIGTFTLSGGGTAVASGGTATASIEPWPNGWYRCKITATPDTAVAGAFLFLDPAVGDGTNGVFWWGAQFEVGSFATNYVPTTTVTLNRTGDIVNILGTNFSSWYSPQQWTTVIEADNLISTQATGQLFSFNDGGNSNRIWLIGGTATSKVQLHSTNGGSDLSLNSTGSIVAGTVYKVAISYNNGTYLMSLNGETPVTLSATAPTVNRLYLGSGIGAGQFNGRIGRFTHYPRAYTGAALQKLSA